LNGEASDTRTEKQNRKFIAGIFVPVMIDWLFHVFSGDEQSGLKHFVVILTIVPRTLVSIKGFSDLQAGHMLNRSSSWDKNTMNFGSVRKFSEISGVL
jgi:hypothetical protein